MSAPATPVEVVRHLSSLTETLQTKVAQYRAAERDAVEKRHAADMVESRAFLRAEGPMDARRHEARVAADHAENQALVAEALVRVLKLEIRALDTQIDVGRTYGATVRAEFKTLGMEASA